MHLSHLTQAEIVNVVLLIAVLHADVGPHKKVTAWRILRPLGIAAGIVPLFIEPLTLVGNGFTIELLGVFAGLVAGAVAISTMRVSANPQTGRVLTQASWPYALLWIGVIGARAAFSYGSEHWFTGSLSHWMISNQVTADAITDALILMAVTMLLTRTTGIAIRARTASAITATPLASRI